MAGSVVAAERGQGRIGGAVVVDRVAWVLLAGLTVLALVRPLIGYDSWWYHLAFSSFIWGIGGGEAAYHPEAMIAARWQGFPLLWETLQGLCWWVTGTLNTIMVPQLVLCLGALAGARRWLGVPGAWLVLGFFACPMLLLHFESTYLDLPAGIGVAALFLVGGGMLADAWDGDARAGNAAAWWSWRRAGVLVGAAVLAGNTKVQGLIGCALASLVLVAFGCLLPRLRLPHRAAFLALVLVADLAAGATGMVNLLRHGNPVYPIAVGVFGKVLFPGPEPATLDEEPPAYLLAGSHAVALPEPVNFLLSATEFDWTMRGVAPWYNIDSVTGRVPRRGPPSRTGGWGGVFVLLNAALLLGQGFARCGDSRQRLLVGGTVLLIVATACVPRAHELRYWLYVPLVATAVNLRFVHQRWGDHAGLVRGVLLALACYGMALVVLSPKSGLLENVPFTEAGRRGAVPDAVVRALAEAGRWCDASEQGETIFQYSTAVTGLQGVVSRRAEDCPSRERRVAP